MGPRDARPFSAIADTTNIRTIQKENAEEIPLIKHKLAKQKVKYKLFANFRCM